MTITDEQIAEWSAITEAATQPYANWHIVRYGDGDSLVIHDARPDRRVCYLSTPGSDGLEAIAANARHIATFDPPTILALLAALTEARARNAVLEAEKLKECEDTADTRALRQKLLNVVKDISVEVQHQSGTDTFTGDDLAEFERAAIVDAIMPALSCARIAALEAENGRLRQHIADTANQINIVGSPLHRVMEAVDEIAADVKRKARAALASNHADD